MQCADLRKADQQFTNTGPCIGIVDLSHDEFSLNGIANLVSSHKQVRWLAFIRESQLSSDTICQFIVNFCIDFFTAPIPDAQLLSTIGHQLGMLQLEKKVWPNYGINNQMDLLGNHCQLNGYAIKLNASRQRMSVFLSPEKMELVKKGSPEPFIIPRLALINLLSVLIAERYPNINLKPSYLVLDIPIQSPFISESSSGDTITQ